jgi:hypothetical protein
MVGIVSGTDYDAFNIGENLSISGLLNMGRFKGFALGSGQVFEIFDVAGMTTGLFDGLNEGGLVGLFGGRELFITYHFGDGNEVALFTKAGPGSTVPEPSTVLLLASGLA